jgi:hypothetical protein
MTHAEAYGAHTEGESTRVYGKDSHAEGYGNIVHAKYAHVEGYGNIVGIENQSDSDVYGMYSHASGHDNTIYGVNIFAHGSNIEIGRQQNSGNLVYDATAFGKGTRALWSDQMVAGKYNLSRYGNLFEIGNGKSINEKDRSNAFEVRENGTAAV